jgi:cell division protein FtsN
MFRCKLSFGMLLLCGAPNVIAQASARPTDPVFVRAQTLVSDGNGVAGRALIDSVIAATPPMAPLYPQALFWRATLAANAADAESDYKHIVVDYPLAPQAADALLRLAQLELARGDKDAALSHLQRIPRDYPRSKSLARASYWTARVLFEKNDVANACAANASAFAQADTTEIELRNQIQYQGQRCPAAPPVPVVASSAPGSSATTIVTSAKPASEPNTLPSTSVPAPVAATHVKAAVDAAKDTVTAQTQSAGMQGSRPKPPTEANDAKPSIVDPTKAARITAEKPPIKGAATGSTTRYSVQVAAYNRKAEADKLVATLKGRGYTARVDGSAAPFRVRIGRYASAKDAEDALKRIRAKHMDGFVVRAPER